MDTVSKYVIKTWRMVEYLEKFGIKMLKSVPDRNNPNYNIFLYEDSLELRHAIDKKKKHSK